jgi:Predicted ester cyclase
MSIFALVTGGGLYAAPAVTGQQSTSEAHSRLMHIRAGKFHANFSTGDFDKNGPLVAKDIQVDSNNVKFVGREKFVQRIKRYSIPFPGLQLKDRIVVVDGNKAAVHYILQGYHKGPYGNIPATGNKIEAMSGEVFEFNDQGLMSKLTTITKLDDVTAEVKGTKKIEAFQDVDLLPTRREDSAYEAKLRITAATFHKNFSAGDFDKNGPLVATNIHVNSNGTMLVGRDSFVNRIKRYKAAFPNLTIDDEYVLVEGNRAAVEYWMQGNQTGPYTLPDGRVLPPTGKKIKVRGIEFMRFNQAGLLDNLITISNGDDFVKQLTQ